MSNELAKIVNEPNSLAAYTDGLQAKLAFCDTLIKSGLVPNQFKTKEAVLAVILKGQELGFSPMASLELFDFIQGKVTIRAAGIAAKIQAEGGSLLVLEETATKCTLKGIRPDRKWEQTYTFTIEQASRMGLAGKDNWKKMPEFMLYARAVSVLGRRGWADRLGGLYGSEEMRDSLDEGAIDVTPKAEPHQNGTVKAQVIESLKSADELPADGPKHRYYSTENVPEGKKEAARMYLDQNGATYDSETQLWCSDKRLAPLDKYEVKV